MFFPCVVVVTEVFFPCVVGCTELFVVCAVGIIGVTAELLFPCINVDDGLMLVLADVNEANWNSFIASRESQKEMYYFSMLAHN